MVKALISTTIARKPSCMVPSRRHELMSKEIKATGDRNRAIKVIEGSTRGRKQDKHEIAGMKETASEEGRKARIWERHLEARKQGRMNEQAHMPPVHASEPGTDNNRTCPHSTPSRTSEPGTCRCTCPHTTTHQ
jgi:hypothetical protein